VAEQGDRIIVTFSQPPALAVFCSGWSAASYPDLIGPNVQVKMDQVASGNSGVIGVVDSSDCAGGFHFGTIDLGQSGYLIGSTTFGGGAGGQCTGSVFIGCTRVHWNGSNTLTITLGKEKKALSMQTAPSVAVYAPDPALGLSGTISSRNEEHF